MPRILSDYSKTAGVATTNQIVIADVKKDSLAREIGIVKGDIILSIQGQTFKNITSFKDTLRSFRNQKVKIIVQRQGKDKSYSVSLPNKKEVLGVYLVENPIYRANFFVSLWLGLQETLKLIGYITVAIYLLIKNLLVSGKVSELATGPIGIYYIASGLSKLGLVYILQFIALISINIGLINLLPVPSLDGGRIMFNSLEGIRGKALNPKIENIIHSTGFVILIILIILVIFRDILRIPYYKSLFG